MSAGAKIFIWWEIGMVTILAVWLLFPSGRQALKRLLLKMRHLYVVMPLRAITGRRAPNYSKIARLQREMLGVQATTDLDAGYRICEVRGGYLATHRSIGIGRVVSSEDDAIAQVVAHQTAQ